MSLVLLETCAVESYERRVMTPLVRALSLLGHEVRRWPRGANIPDGCTIIWWGCNVQPGEQLKANRARARVLYLERGWTHDRDDCFQLDPAGVGGLASWAEEPLPVEGGGAEPLRINRKATGLLVVLRFERPGKKTDNVDQLSPYFPNNVQWLQHLYAASRLPIQVRVHPDCQPGVRNGLYHETRLLGFAWDAEPNFLVSMKRHIAVAVIDSTAGVWALECGVPVLCYGRAVYRHPRVVYPLDARVEGTQHATEELRNGRCSLDAGAVQSMLARIRSRQWYAKDAATFPERLQREFGL